MGVGGNSVVSSYATVVSSVLGGEPRGLLFSPQYSRVVFANSAG